MVGIVVVSHSPALADGVVELARQMGGDEVSVEAAGGLEDGSIGTDAERVRAAIERARSDAGVLVLMDLGSALMSAEMAVELLDDGDGVVLSEAPLVEGAVAAAAAASGGASLEEVRAEAGRALRMKAAQLDAPESAAGAADADAEAGGHGHAGDLGDRYPAGVPIPIVNPIGLHARPAALVVKLAGRFDADLRLRKPGAAGPVSARSLTGLMTLVARQGDELVATASGPQAEEALAALQELARDGFGEGVGDGAPPPAPSVAERDQVAAAPTDGAAAPEPGTVLRGIPASPGVALGPVRHLDASAPPPPLDRPARDEPHELGRLDDARAAAAREIERDRADLRRRGATAEAEIFAAHLALLDDDALIGAARQAIADGASAEAAWHAATVDTAAAWRGLDDERLAERATDVEDVGSRVLAVLTGHPASARMREAGVLVVSELTPAAAAALDGELVRAIATARGTATAHAAIIARALGIPAAVGLGSAVTALAAGTPVLLDGDEGTLLVAPSDEVAERARRQREATQQSRREARRHASEPAVMADGTRIEVAANLGDAGGAAEAVALGADGVGLLRTEFLYLDRAQMPSEDEQVQTLTRIARELEGRPLIVRTLDAGADKPLPALPMAPEQNPFLGQRGIRLSLEHPELLATQLRAVLRVAAKHPVKLMFPMVATLAELQAARSAVARAREQTGITAPLEVGIMVEVPAAAVRARQLASLAGFFSIGTNDLTQYTMAAERGNERVGELLSGPQPAVLELVRATVAGAQTHGRWVGVCGELAGDPAAAVLLVGLGVRELSMAPPLVGDVKAALRSVTLAGAQDAAGGALSAPDSGQARQCAADVLG